MHFLSKENLLAWREKLPDDVLSCTDEITDEGQASADEIGNSLGNISNDEIVSFVHANQEKFIEMGKTRRIRFLAWCTARFYRDPVGRENLIKALTKGADDTSGDSEGERTITAPYFHNDMVAFVEALGPRAAGLIVDGNTLSTIAGVGFEIASDLEMRGGRK